MDDEESTPLNSFLDYDSVQGSIQSPRMTFLSDDNQHKSNSSKFTLLCIEHIVSHQHNLCLNGKLRPNSHANLFVEDLKRWFLELTECEPISQPQSNHHDQHNDMSKYDLALFGCCKYLKCVLDQFEWCFPLNGTFPTCHSSVIKTPTSSSKSQAFVENGVGRNSESEINPHKSLHKLLNILLSETSSYLFSRIRYLSSHNQLKGINKEEQGGDDQSRDDSLYIEISQIMGHVIHVFNDGRKCLNFLLLSDTENTTLLSDDIDSQPNSHQVSQASQYFETQVHDVKQTNECVEKATLSPLSSAFQLSPQTSMQVSPMYNTPDDAILISLLNGCSLKTGLLDMSLSEHVSCLKVFEPISSLTHVKRRVTFSTLNLISHEKKCEDCVHVYENILNSTSQVINRKDDKISLEALGKAAEDGEENSNIIYDMERRDITEIEKEDVENHLFKSKVKEAFEEIKTCWDDGKSSDSMSDPKKHSGTIAMNKVCEILTCLLKLATLVGWLDECLELATHSTETKTQNRNITTPNNIENGIENNIENDVDLLQYGVPLQFFNDLQQLPSTSSMIQIVELIQSYSNQSTNEETSHETHKFEMKSILLDFPLNNCLLHIINECKKLKKALSQLYRQTSRINQVKLFEWHHFMSSSMVSLGHVGHHISMINEQCNLIMIKLKRNRLIKYQFYNLLCLNLNPVIVSTIRKEENIHINSSIGEDIEGKVIENDKIAEEEKDMTTVDQNKEKNVFMMYEMFLNEESRLLSERMQKSKTF